MIDKFSINTERLKCSSCGVISLGKSWLVADNPFDRGQVVLGCPKCKSCETHERACDTPGCPELACCGTPTKDGYFMTCGDHIPERGLEEGE